MTFFLALAASILGLFAPAAYWATIVIAVAGVGWVFVRASGAARGA
ncbi:hypothetical protein [Microbacterium sp. NPDC058389]